MQRAPGIPHALVFRGAKVLRMPRALCVAGANACLNGRAVIARSASDEAIHSFARQDGLLRGACHRARIRATRWLAMTASKRLGCLKNRIGRRHAPRHSGAARWAEPGIQSAYIVVAIQIGRPPVQCQDFDVRHRTGNDRCPDVAAFAADGPMRRAVPSIHQCLAVNSSHRPAFDDTGKNRFGRRVEMNVELPFRNVPMLFG